MEAPRGLEKELADAVERSQNQYEGRIKQVDDKIQALSREERRRKHTATALKVTTVVLGIALAPGILQQWHVQAIGIVILLIVALERVFANHGRLVSITSARDAYARIRRETEDVHERELLPIIKIRESKPQDAANKLIALNEKLRSMLATTSSKVEDALAQDNYQLLGRLTLEEQKGQSTR